MSKLGLALRLLAHRFSGATLHDEVRNGDALLVRALLSQGVHQPDETDPKDEYRRETVLYLAVCLAHFACAVELLKFGADPNGSNGHLFGVPFWRAVESCKFAFLPLLLYYGATPFGEIVDRCDPGDFIKYRLSVGGRFLSNDSIYKLFPPEFTSQLRDDLPHLREGQEQVKQAYKTSKIAALAGSAVYKKETLMQALQQDIDTAGHLYDVVNFEEALRLKYQQSSYFYCESLREEFIQTTNEALAYFSKEMLQVYARLINFFELLPSEGWPLLASSTIRLDDSGDKEPSGLTLTQEILLAHEKELRSYLDTQDEECQQIMQAFDQLRHRISAQAFCARRARENSGASSSGLSSTSEEMEMTVLGGPKLKME